MHTLIIINPGHFHAGLVLKESHPRLSDTVYVYADPGPDLDRFRTTHEEHFCQVRDAFLEYLHAGAVPPEERYNLVSKYSLLASARKRALTSPFEPLPLSVG